MDEVLRNQSTVAVLNANPVTDSLKYLLTDLWLQLLYRARDRNPRLPRVALEVRELKNLAPSKLGDSSHSHIVKSLQQTFFFLSSQGGSSRILILGSTQKLNDVYKPVRGNMPIKILMQVGPEKISTLENAGYSFSPEQKQQLNEFDAGWGMLQAHGNWIWPIQWAGAHCGLGIGDIPWRDRYGEVAGFRVASRSTRIDGWYDVRGQRVTERAPTVGEWYLTEDDVAEARGFEAAIQHRRDDGLQSDLTLQPVDVDTGRELDLLSQQDHRERLVQRIEDKHGSFPAELEPWLDHDLARVDEFLDVLRAVREYPIGSYADFSDVTEVSGSTVSTWKNRGDNPPLQGLLKKAGEFYMLTSPGQRALQFPWRDYLD
jgi:hypothetical protein